MTFNLIPAGTFMMGSSEDETGSRDDETLHEVTLTKSFYMQTTEVTQKQWEVVTGENPSYFQNCGDNCPVERASWDDVQEFISKINQRGEGTYRLPTEAEWEYAARAGSDTAIYTGSMTSLGYNAPELDSIAWYGGNSCVDYSGGRDCSGWDEKQYSCSSCGTHPVARKVPNAWGLYDISGNVREWCQDWYGSYPADSVADPTGPSSGEERVARGGSWNDVARGCRSADRYGFLSADRRFSLGFRLVLLPKSAVSQDRQASRKN